MAIKNTDHRDHTAPVPEQTVLDADAFQACQSELKDFVGATCDRLQSLSGQLSHSQPRQRITRDVHLATDDSAADCDDSLLTIEQCESKVPQRIDPTTDSPENAFGNDDPMERLNAIKLRLADQMQNAS